MTITLIPEYELVEVVSYPTKTVYNVGEDLDLSGVSIKARSATRWFEADGNRAGTMYGQPQQFDDIELSLDQIDVISEDGTKTSGSKFNTLPQGSYTVRFSGRASRDRDFREIYISRLEFPVTVNDGSQNTTSTTKPKDETSDVSVWGDANLDGQVDMADAVLIMQSLANPNKYGVGGSDAKAITEQGKANADVDTSTKGITTNDALQIQLYLLKKIATLDPKG